MPHYPVFQDDILLCGTFIPKRKMPNVRSVADLPGLPPTTENLT
jgi:hypothetical protein